MHLHTSPLRQSFDSLFINNDYGDGDTNIEGWDYLVYSGGAIHAEDNIGPIPGDGLWSVNETYEYTTNSTAGRVGHATGIKSSSLDQTRISDLTGVHQPNIMIISYLINHITHLFF